MSLARKLCLRPARLLLRPSGPPALRVPTAAHYSTADEARELTPDVFLHAVSLLEDEPVAKPHQHPAAPSIPSAVPPAPAPEKLFFRLVRDREGTRPAAGPSRAPAGQPWLEKQNPFADLTMKWWREQDRCLDPGWVELLPPGARAVAYAKRSHLEQWPLCLRQLFGPKWDDEAARQNALLHRAHTMLVHRIGRAEKHVRILQTRHYEESFAIDSLIRRAHKLLQRWAWFAHLEHRHGISWGEAFEQVHLASLARYGSNGHSFRTGNTVRKALRRTTELVSDTERSLARLQWYKQLEEQHGEGWERVAEANAALWTEKWDAAQPGPLIHSCEDTLAQCKILSADIRYQSRVYLFWDRIVKGEAPSATMTGNLETVPSNRPT